MFRGSRTVFQPLRRGSSCSGHHQIIASNQVCLRLHLFSLWFEGTTCLLTFFFWRLISFSLLTLLVLMCWWGQSSGGTNATDVFRLKIRFQLTACLKNKQDLQHIPLFLVRVLFKDSKLRFTPTILTSELAIALMLCCVIHQINGTVLEIHTYVLTEQCGNLNSSNYQSANLPKIVFKWTPKVSPDSGWSRGPQLAAFGFIVTLLQVHLLRGTAGLCDGGGILVFQTWAD